MKRKQGEGAGQLQNAPTGVSRPSGPGPPDKRQKVRAPPISHDEQLEGRFVALCEQHPDGLREDALEAAMGDVELIKRAHIINSLLQRGRLQLFRAKDVIVYKLVGNEDAKKFRGLGPEDMLVYQLVEKEQNKGIWINTLRKRSNLSQPACAKALKTLMTRQLVKAITPASSKQKVFMLYELEPAEGLTGTDWFGDEEFVNLLKKTCLKAIESKGSSSPEELLAFARSTGIFQANLKIKDVITITESLKFDGSIEKDSHTPNILSESLPLQTRQAMTRYKMVKKGPLVSAFLYVPCSVCPVVDKCSDGGVINPVICPYLGTWLDF